MDTAFLQNLITSIWTVLLVCLGLLLFGAAVACSAAMLVRQQRRREALRYGTVNERDLRLHDYEVDQLTYATAGFWGGVAFAGLAVLSLVTALFWLNLHEPFLQQPVTLICLLGAFLCGVIAALLLFQSAQTRKLFEVLLRDRKITESVRLVASLPDPQVRARAQITLAMQLAGVGALDVAAMQVLVRKAAERQQHAQRRSERVYRVLPKPGKHWARG